MIWRPTGRPFAARPAGTLAAGCPVRFAGIEARRPGIVGDRDAVDRAGSVAVDREGRERRGRRQDQVESGHEPRHGVDRGLPRRDGVGELVRRPLPGEERREVAATAVLAALRRDHSPQSDDVGLHRDDGAVGLDRGRRTASLSPRRPGRGPRRNGALRPRPAASTSESTGRPAQRGHQATRSRFGQRHTRRRSPADALVGKR